MLTQDDMVFSYTRKKAIEDGTQVALSEQFPDACKIFNFPTFCTEKVWRLIESAVKEQAALNDINGVIRDISIMATRSPSRKLISQGSGVEFTVIVTGASIKPEFYEGCNPIYRLQALCGPMDLDDPRPAITIAFPDEQ